MRWVIDDHYGGIDDADKYRIADTPETEAIWKRLIENLRREFSELSVARDGKSGDYELATWHYQTMSVFVYIYSDRVYSLDFIPRVQRMLNSERVACFAEFECHLEQQRLINRFMVFKDKVIFDRRCESSGLVDRLIDSPSD